MASELIVQNLKGPAGGSNPNTVILPAGHTLDTSGGTLVPSAGQILQVVQYSRTTSNQANLGRVDVSSSTFVDIFSKSITTTVANSKIRVMVNCNSYNGTSVLRGRAQVFRDSTAIIYDPYAWHSAQGDMMWWHSDHIDEPSVSAGTTLTYKIQANNTGAGTMSYRYTDGGGSTHNSLTLMEIAQ